MQKRPYKGLQCGLFVFLLALGPRIVTPAPGSYAYGNSVHLAHADERKADEYGHPAAGGRLGGRLP